VENAECFPLRCGGSYVICRKVQASHHRAILAMSLLEGQPTERYDFETTKPILWINRRRSCKSLFRRSLWARWM